MIQNTLIVALISALLSFSGTWYITNKIHAGKLAEIKAEHAIALFEEESRARSKEALLTKNNTEVTNAYLAEKAKSSAATARLTTSGRLLSEALASAEASRSSQTDSRTFDPRGTIAGECAEALRAMDGYAQQLANKARALQEYTTGVCLVPTK